MDNQLQSFRLKATYINDGNKEDISEVVLDRYFNGALKKMNSPHTSCAWKHLLAYQKINSSSSPYSLILEDDIEFYPDFCMLLDEILVEISSRKLTNFIVSLEDSLLQYIAGSERRKGQYLYKQLKGRMTGAYLIDQTAASGMLKFATDEKIHLTMDWFHNICAEKEIIDIYWCQPPLACQASLNGKMRSIIDPDKGSKFQRITFSAERFYKRLLYMFR